MSVPPATPRRLDGRFRIRQAAVGDLPALARIAVAAGVDTVGADRLAEAWGEQAQRGGYFWAVVDTYAPAASDGSPAWVGVAHACPRRDSDVTVLLELAEFHLLETTRGSGIDARLLEISIGDAPAYVWVVAEDEEQVSFLSGQGFVPDGAERPREADGNRQIRLVRG